MNMLTTAKETLTGVSGLLLGLLGLIIGAVPFIIGVATAAQDDRFILMVMLMMFPPAGWLYGLFTIVMGML